LEQLYLLEARHPKRVAKRSLGPLSASRMRPMAVSCIALLGGGVLRPRLGTRKNGQCDANEEIRGYEKFHEQEKVIRTHYDVERA
jgi:hypothetical protein